MAKTKISEYDSTAANNTDIDSINIAEGCAPSGINNAIRELMAHLKDMDISSIQTSSGDLTIDVDGDIDLDADGGDVNLKDGGTTYAHLSKSSNDFFITNPISNGDILFRGNDGSFITALQLDMSNAGTAIFNNRVGLGTNPSYPLEVSLGQSDAAARFARGNTNVGMKNLILFRSSSAGADVGSIQITNSATSYVTSSDHRLKENVETLSNGITRVKQLQPKRFSWIIDEEDSANQDGFLAHEAQTVVPESVSGTHDGVEVWEEGEELPDGVSVGDNKLDEDGNTIPEYQGIDQAKIVPLLTAALQEAIAKIETLETKVAALEG